MVEHDGQVGQLLKKLDDLGIADNTIVIYTTDNGAETFTWPDGGTTPFRGEKNTNWEGSYRVPAMVRWPGLVQPRTEINEIFSAEDWVQTLMAAAGEPDIADKLLQGYNAGGKTFKVHLDGYDQRDLLAGKGPTSAANSSTGPTTAISPGCATTSTRRCSWSSRRTAWRSGCSRWFRCARRSCSTCAPIRSSAPSTRPATTYKWFIEHVFVLVPAQAIVAQHLQTFQEFPPRQKPGSFSVDQAMEKLTSPKSSN